MGLFDTGTLGGGNSCGNVFELGFTIGAHEHFLAWVFINRLLEQLTDLLEIHSLCSDHITAVLFHVDDNDLGSGTQCLAWRIRWQSHIVIPTSLTNLLNVTLKLRKRLANEQSLIGHHFPADVRFRML
ncbi:uncharacterized protein METZ01_LOCUS461696, partial [marine metagenome]